MRGNTLIKKEKELSNMARIRKEYKMTEKNVEYIEEVKEKILWKSRRKNISVYSREMKCV